MSGRPSVLVVDDETLTRTFLCTALETIASVVEAKDGEQALEILQSGMTIDFVLMDQVLPRRSGIEVLKVTKRAWPWIPVGLLTPHDVHFGLADQRVAERAAVLTTAYAAHPERFPDDGLIGMARHRWGTRSVRNPSHAQAVRWW